jgi:hypothetical protein
MSTNKEHGSLKPFLHQSDQLTLKMPPSVFQMSVVPQSQLQKMEEDIDEVKSILKQKADDEVMSQWLDSVTVCKMLKVSAKTWQDYRNKRVIPFSQFGSKIYVKRSDIEAFMQSHYISSRKEGGHL